MFLIMTAEMRPVAIRSQVTDIRIADPALGSGTLADHDKTFINRGEARGNLFQLEDVTTTAGMLLKQSAKQQQLPTNQ